MYIATLIYKRPPYQLYPTRLFCSYRKEKKVKVQHRKSEQKGRGEVS
jgi:hypothetical protein